MTAPQPRYFYSDPLAAAWMAKHYGMAFHDGNLEEILWPWDHLYDPEFDGKSPAFFIHPDSLHLLNPIDGDKDEDGFVFCSTTKGWWRECGDDGQGGKIYRVKMHHESHPAKRNGLVFHWPQSEAA